MEGGSLTFLELKRLDTTLKKDYMKQVMLRDEVSNMYVEQQMKQLEAANKEMDKAIKDIDQIQDTWDEAVDAIDKAMVKKAIAEGISTNKFKNIEKNMQGIIE